MSLDSVQSFVIENCNGPTIENGLNNVCLHPLSRTFTFFYDNYELYFFVFRFNDYQFTTVSINPFTAWLNVSNRIGENVNYTLRVII